MKDYEKMKKRMREVWKNTDAWDIAEEALEKAMVLCDMYGRPQGSIDGCVVYDIENEEICVLQESAGQYTPGYIYMYRVNGEHKPDDVEEVYEDLIRYIPMSIDSLGGW